MDEESENRVLVRRSSGSRIGGVDRLSDLPDYLLCEILLNLPTSDVVQSSVLSKRWRNLWRYVPGLALGYDDFPEYEACMRFIDRFLGFNNQSSLKKFELKESSRELPYEWEWDEADNSHVTRWIDMVLNRKVQHLHILENIWHSEKNLDMPIGVYTSESLVSLKLYEVILPNPKSVSLPSVKVIALDRVKFASNWAFEMFISGCSALERLTIERRPYDNVRHLRVCSQSLLKFTHVGHYDEFIKEEQVVAIDAPKLETLKLFDAATDSFEVKNLGSLIKVDLNIEFNLSLGKRFDPNDLPKRNMIRNFLIGISNVKDMEITSETLQGIYNYSRCEQIPLLRNLSSLRTGFNDYLWEMLPIFLESCPNLKSLSLVFSRTLGEQPVCILPRPHRVLPSLEYVEIIKSMGGSVADMELVSYFLENSKILKKLTLQLSYFKEKDHSVFIKELLTIPRLSSSCQVFVT